MPLQPPVREAIETALNQAAASAAELSRNLKRAELERQEAEWALEEAKASEAEARRASEAAAEAMRILEFVLAAAPLNEELGTG